MIWMYIIGLSFALAMDAFAVSVATALQLGPVSRRQVFRIAFHFGLFQFLMPILGWLAGTALAEHFAAFDHWVAFFLLAYLGGKMIKGTNTESVEEEREAPDPTRGLSLMMLSIAVSIDALSVGLSIAFLDLPVWTACIVIGIVTGLLSAAGMLAGARVPSRWRRWAELAGGSILIVVGLKVVLVHLGAV